MLRACTWAEFMAGCPGCATCLEMSLARVAAMAEELEAIRAEERGAVRQYVQAIVRRELRRSAFNALHMSRFVLQ